MTFVHYCQFNFYLQHELLLCIQFVAGADGVTVLSCAYELMRTLLLRIYAGQRPPLCWTMTASVLDYEHLFSGVRPPLYVLDNNHLCAGLCPPLCWTRSTSLLEYDDRLCAGLRYAHLCAGAPPPLCFPVID